VNRSRSFRARDPHTADTVRQESLSIVAAPFDGEPGDFAESTRRTTLARALNASSAEDDVTPAPKVHGELMTTHATLAGGPRVTVVGSSRRGEVTMRPRAGSAPDWLADLTDVLIRAADGQRPVLDRARLLVHYALRLDDLLTSGVAVPAFASLGDDGAEAADLAALLRSMNVRHDKLLCDDVLPLLAADGIACASWNQLRRSERRRAHEIWRSVIHPLVTPLALNGTHPSLDVASLRVNLGVLLRDRVGRSACFVCVEVPAGLPTFLRLDRTRVLRVADLLSASLPDVFSGVQVLERSSFRLTRATDNDVHAMDSAGSRGRRTRGVRRGSPVRLEVESTMSADMCGILQKELLVPMDRVCRFRATPGSAVMLDALIHEVDQSRRRTAVAPPT
jgi:polyphosphate kinase